MSFSMFLRKTVAVSTRRAYCTNVPRCFVPMNLARHVSTVLPIKTLSHNGFTTTPILDSVRALRTSAVHQQHPEKAHDHARLWVIEKMTSALLVFIVPLGLAMPNKIVDCIAAVLITIHSFWGLEAMAVEYIRTIIFGPIIPKIVKLLIFGIAATMLGGFFYLIFNDRGLFNTFWMIWHSFGGKSGGGGGADGAGGAGGAGGSGSGKGSSGKVCKGLEAIAVDYVRAAIFGPLIPKVAIALVYAVCISMLAGLFYLISHDVGMFAAIKQLWSVKSASAQNA